MTGNSAPSGAAEYVVESLGDPDIALRAFNLFAQRGLAPELLHMTREGERQITTIRQPDLPPETAAIIAAKLEAIIGVTSVVARISPAAPSPSPQ